ncbi:hypothetical protein ACODT3_11500 [Streptomyces sp. 4.24]|uniref:hypothetical protein n=1 Tax=Streptomyces tritrimontium TaxID=3406573 RepID=UPI003BB59A5A
MLTAPPGGRTARGLLDAGEFMAVTATLARDRPDIGWEYAEQVVVETLKFVAAAAQSDERLVPSPIVDEGFHALLVNTEVHRILSARLGVFVHHYPAVDGAAPIVPGRLQRSVDAIRRVGFTEDKEMWT